MATLSFAELTNDKKTEAGKQTWRGTSPFQDNVEFNITGFTYKVAVVDGKQSDHVLPILTTTVGDAFVSMFTKLHPATDGTPRKAEGTAVELLLNTIAANSGKTNDEVLSAVVAAFKDKKVRVTRRSYNGLTREGKTMAASVPDFNLVG